MARGLFPPGRRCSAARQPAGTVLQPREQEQSHSSPLGPTQPPARSPAICKTAANYERPQHPSARWRGYLAAELTCVITLTSRCPPSQTSTTSSPLLCRHPGTAVEQLVLGPSAAESRHRVSACTKPSWSNIPELSQHRQGAQAGSEQRGAGAVSKAPLLPGPTSSSVLPKMKARLFRNSHLLHRDLHFAFWPLFLVLMRSFMGKTSTSSSRVSPFSFASQLKENSVLGKNSLSSAARRPKARAPDPSVRAYKAF